MNKYIFCFSICVYLAQLPLGSHSAKGDDCWYVYFTIVENASSNSDEALLPRYRTAVTRGMGKINKERIILTEPDKATEQQDYLLREPPLSPTVISGGVAAADPRNVDMFVRRSSKVSCPKFPGSNNNETTTTKCSIVPGKAPEKWECALKVVKKPGNKKNNRENYFNMELQGDLNLNIRHFIIVRKIEAASDVESGVRSETAGIQNASGVEIETGPGTQTIEIGFTGFADLTLSESNNSKALHSLRPLGLKPSHEDIISQLINNNGYSVLITTQNAEELPEHSYPLLNNTNNQASAETHPSVQDSSKAPANLWTQLGDNRGWSAVDKCYKFSNFQVCEEVYLAITTA